MTRYRRLLVTVLGAATLILLPSSTAGASPPTETRTIEVHAEYTEPQPGIGAECHGLEKGDPWCQAVFPGPVTFTGTIAGEAWAESAGPTRGLHQYEGPDTFEHAVVEGCGEGRLILDTFEGALDFTDTTLDGNGLSTGGYNKWRIRPGSGTGTLTGIRGEGVNHWRPYWTETGDQWGRGTYTGTITCEVPSTPAPRKRVQARTITVQSQLTAPMSSLAGAGCAVSMGEPWCRASFITTLTLNGTMSGTGLFEDAGPTPDGHHATGTATFEQLRIDGCGEGGLALDAVADFDVTDTNPADLSTGAHETWTLRSGTGTGGLAGVVAVDLVNDWRAYWIDGEQWARGDVTGTITCEMPVNESRDELRVAAAAAAGEPSVAVLGAGFAPGELPRTGGAAVAGLVGAVLLGAGLAGRRVGRA